MTEGPSKFCILSSAFELSVGIGQRVPFLPPLSMVNSRRSTGSIHGNGLSGPEANTNPLLLREGCGTVHVPITRLKLELVVVQIR